MQKYLEEHSKLLQAVLHEVLSDSSETFRLRGQSLEEVRETTGLLLRKVFMHADLQSLKGLAPISLYLCDGDIRGPPTIEDRRMSVQSVVNWDNFFNALEHFGHEPSDFAKVKPLSTVSTCQGLNEHAKGLSWPGFESLNKKQASALFSMVNLTALRTLASCIGAESLELNLNAVFFRLKVRAGMVLAGKEDDVELVC